MNQVSDTLSLDLTSNVGLNTDFTSDVGLSLDLNKYEDVREIELGFSLSTVKRVGESDVLPLLTPVEQQRWIKCPHRLIP